MQADAQQRDVEAPPRGAKSAAFWLKEESLSVLLGMLLVVIFVLPAFGLRVNAVVSDVVFGLLLLSGVAAVGRSRLALGLTGALVAVSLVLSWTGLARAGGTPRVVEVVATLVSLVLFITLVLARAVSPGPITRHRVEGAVAAFLLMGLACAVGFELLDLLDPGSLGGLAGLDPRKARQEIGYFSLVTLTTVGYGDVTPLSEGARSLATFEGLLGQLYPAVTIGWMVSQLPGRQR